MANIRTLTATLFRHPMTTPTTQSPIATADANRAPLPGRSERSSLREVVGNIDFRSAGDRMHSMIADLYPICRSITGNGIRETLRRIRDIIPIKIHEVPTGTKVHDWTIPREWNIRDAWVKNAQGEKVIDFANSNLHVVSYSIPVRRKMSLAELRQHLHSIPDRPDWIPYRTSYYKQSWGFCLAHKQLVSLEDGAYEVCIDSDLEDGSLSYGECCIPGESTDEVLLSCHACHPSLCNDNLSGVALVTALVESLQQASLNYTYRVLLIPGSIGSITWLAVNEHQARRIRHGLVVACVGDSGKLQYKRSRQGNAEIDRAVLHTLRHRASEYGVEAFSPYGYDERQYCSPGFDLAVGSLTRTPHGRFPQYHTSADDLEFVRPESLSDTLQAYLSVISVLESNTRYINTNPKCEPQLGKRGLYRATGGHATAGDVELAMLWVLNYSDGTHDLLDIADRSGLSFDSISTAARMLSQHGLLRECAPKL